MPAAKKPAAKKQTSDVSARETAEAAEHELQTLIEHAATDGWQPAMAERCDDLAKVAAQARATLGEEPAGHTIRFL